MNKIFFQIFDLRSKRLIQCYDEHKKSVTNLALNPNGFYMASSSVDETVKIWDLRVGQMLYTLNGHEVN